MRPTLDGLRVLDRSAGIAGPYCTKLLADAGADVVKVEAAADPLRAWGTGALFEYLNAGKRSVVDDTALLPAADLIVTDRPIDRPDVVVVTITPFGTTGPWAGRPATEFTLQAWCGSTGLRGVPEQPPLAAGGRIGEWIAGTYAAAAALAALRERARSGQGEQIDVALLDCMTVTLATFPSVFASFLGWPPLTGTGRTVEVPSVEPTSDGYAVFTTNSAQQFHDFLVMIGRSDLLDDHALARVAPRFKRRHEFLAAVHEYTTKRTTDEVLDDAAALRIPSGPVLNGATVTAFPQFAERDVFVPAASGRFVAPRPPYRIGAAAAEEACRLSPAPALGEHDGAVVWPHRPPAVAREWRLPLAGLRVLDCTAWWAGPVAPHALAALGADVIKVESVTRPDLMRYSATKPPTEDRWWEWGPLFHAVNAGKRGITLDLTRPEGVEMFERLVRTADVLLENYTPRVMEQFGLGWERIHAVNPAVVMVRMPAFGLDGPWRDRTGFAQTMECVAGMAWLTGFADGPPVLVRGACDPIAGMHAVVATLLALAERDRDGEGRLVESIMVEAALNVAAEQVVELGAGGPLQHRDGNRGPYAAPQGVYPCAGEDQWVAVAVATDQQWESLCAVIPEPPQSGPERRATGPERRAAHDGIDEWIAAWTGERSAEGVVEVLVAAGVPAAVVVPGRDVVFNPQLRSRGLFEEEDHPVTGRHELPGLPVRFSRVERWNRRPSPTLGQHNHEVLAEVATPEEIARLLEAGVIGDRVT